MIKTSVTRQYACHIAGELYHRYNLSQKNYVTYIFPWKTDDEKIKYVPLQVKQGDLAVFLQGGAYEVIYQGEKYFIVPQSSILMIEREEF